MLKSTKELVFNNWIGLGLSNCRQEKKDKMLRNLFKEGGVKREGGHCCICSPTIQPPLVGSKWPISYPWLSALNALIVYESRNAIILPDILVSLNWIADINSGKKWPRGLLGSGWVSPWRPWAPPAWLSKCQKCECQKKSWMKQYFISKVYPPPS